MSSHCVETCSKKSLDAGTVHPRSLTHHTHQGHDQWRTVWMLALLLGEPPSTAGHGLDSDPRGYPAGLMLRSGTSGWRHRFEAGRLGATGARRGRRGRPSGRSRSCTRAVKDPSAPEPSSRACRGTALPSMKPSSGAGCRALARSGAGSPFSAGEGHNEFGGVPGGQSVG